MSARRLAAMTLLFAMVGLPASVPQFAWARAPVQRPHPAGTVGVRNLLGPFPSDAPGTVIDFGEVMQMTSSYILPLAFQGYVAFDTEWQMTLKALQDFTEVDPGERAPNTLPVGRLKWRRHGVEGAAWTPVTMADTLVAEGQAGAATLVTLDFCMDVQSGDPPGYYCTELVFTVTPALDLAASRADPNPFSPGSASPGVKDVTNIYYETSGGEMAVRIYDSDGNLVDSVLDFQFHEPGWHFVTWDGRNLSGSYVNEGRYYYHIVRRAESGEEEVAAKGLIKVDITPPVVSVREPRNGQFVTDVVKVSGRSDPEAAVYVAYDNEMNEVCGRLVCDGNGGYSGIVPAKAGRFDLWFIAEDHAGNRKATSVALTGESIVLSRSWFTTDRETAAIEGLAPPHSEVVVSVNGRPVGACSADPSGRFTIPEVPLVRGRNLVTASSTAADGSAISTPKPLIIWRRDSAPGPARSISGVVVDAADGTPIHRARVVLTSLGERLGIVSGCNPAEVYTPASGEFGFTGLSDGVYLLKVEAPGYAGRQHGPIAVDGKTLPGPVTVELAPAVALGIKKTAGRTHAEAGDVLTYAIRVTNAGREDIDSVVVQDYIPQGMSLIAGTGRLSGDTINDPAWNAERGAWEWQVGTLRALETLELTYKVAIGLDCPEGEEVARASAYGRNSAGDVVAAGPSQTAVYVTHGPFGREALVLGRVFADLDGDGVFGPGDRPLGGVRAVMEDGLAVYTDGLGRFAVPGVAPGFHVIAVAAADIPAGYRLSRSSRDPIRVPPGTAMFVGVALEPDAGEREDTFAVAALAQCEAGAALTSGAHGGPYTAAGVSLWYTGEPLDGWALEAGLDLAGPRNGASSLLPGLPLPASRTSRLPHAGPLYLSIGREDSRLTYGMIRTGFGHPATYSAYDRVLPQLQARFAGEKGELVLFDALAGQVPAWEEYALEMGSRSFRLRKAPVVPGSEVVRVVMKDRQDPRLTFFTRDLASGQDYVLDYESGRLTLLGEGCWTGYDGLPFLVVSYEFAPPAQDLQCHIMGARAAWASDDGIAIAAHVIRESQSPEPLYLAGIAGKYEGDGVKVSGEYAVSSARPERAAEDKPKAVGLSLALEVAPGLNLSGHYQQVGAGFVNPARSGEDDVVRYGLGCEASTAYGLTLRGGVEVADAHDPVSQSARRKTQWFVSGCEGLTPSLTGSARLSLGSEADAATGERLSSSFETAFDLDWRPRGPVDLKASWTSTTTSDASGQTILRDDSLGLKVGFAPKENLRASVQYGWRPGQGLDSGALKLDVAFVPAGEYSISCSCTFGPERGTGAVSVSAAGTLWDSLTVVTQYDRVAKVGTASRRLELSAAYRPETGGEGRHMAVFGSLSLAKEAQADQADGSPEGRVEGSVVGIFEPLDGLEVCGRYAVKALAEPLRNETQPLTTRLLGLTVVRRFCDRWDITGQVVTYLQDELEKRQQEYTLEVGWDAGGGLRLAIGCRNTTSLGHGSGARGPCETKVYLALGFGLMHGL